MSDRHRMGVQDALWLEMDRPSNLMVVDGLVWTSEPIDWENFTDVARERLWDRYRVFRSIAVHDGVWHWEECENDSFESHLSRVRLPEPGGDAELQQFVSSKRTEPLDRSRPLWQIFCIDDYNGGSAVLTRIHHAIADGIRIVQLAMSLFDAAPEGGPILAPPAPNHAARPAAPHRSLPERMRDEVGAAAGEMVELANELGDAIGEVLADPLGKSRAGLAALSETVGEATSFAARTAGQSAGSLTNPIGAVHGAAEAASAAAGSTAAWLRGSLRPRLPGQGPLIEMFSSTPADVDFARKLLLGTRNDPTIWSGPVGPDKKVAWSEPLPLASVKEVARRHDATVNDVLVTCVAGALHTYLAEHDARCASVNFMIPVNLKPIDLTLPEELGNSFAIVQLELPTGTGDPLAVLDVVKERMGRIKQGHEAALAFRLQELISGLSDTLYRATVDLLANRAAGVLTNVPGPPIPVYLAGRRVDGMVGWAPNSGDQSLSFTIYSYDGKVFVGIACDAESVPDHEQIVDGFGAAFHRLSIAVR